MNSRQIINISLITGSNNVNWCNVQRIEYFWMHCVVQNCEVAENSADDWLKECFFSSRNRRKLTNNNWESTFYNNGQVWEHRNSQMNWKHSKFKSPSRPASSRVKNPIRLTIFLSKAIQCLERSQTIAKVFISGG